VDIMGRKYSINEQQAQIIDIELRQMGPEEMHGDGQAFPGSVSGSYDGTLEARVPTARASLITAAGIGTKIMQVTTLHAAEGYRAMRDTIRQDREAVPGEVSNGRDAARLTDHLYEQGFRVHRIHGMAFSEDVVVIAQQDGIEYLCNMGVTSRESIIDACAAKYAPVVAETAEGTDTIYLLPPEHNFNLVEYQALSAELDVRQDPAVNLDDDERLASKIAVSNNLSLTPDMMDALQSRVVPEADMYAQVDQGSRFPDMDDDGEPIERRQEGISLHAIMFGRHRWHDQVQ
jgi:hypothetical protein